MTPVQADFTPASVPPPVITTPMTCEFRPAIPAGVLFAGLAVGMTGVYQVELEVPSNAAGSDRLVCAFTRSGSTILVEGYLPIR